MTAPTRSTGSTTTINPQVNVSKDSKKEKVKGDAAVTVTHQTNNATVKVEGKATTQGQWQVGASVTYQFNN